MNNLIVNAYCEAKCKHQVNGYKLSSMDLSTVLICGAYLLGSSITDENKSGTSAAPLENVMLIVSNGGTNEVNQIIVDGDKIWKRVITTDGNPIAFSSCTSWQSINFIISETEPTYEAGAIWFKPIAD